MFAYEVESADSAKHTSLLEIYFLVKTREDKHSLSAKFVNKGFSLC